MRTCSRGALARPLTRARRGEKEEQPPPGCSRTRAVGVDISPDLRNFSYDEIVVPSWLTNRSRGDHRMPSAERLRLGQRQQRVFCATISIPNGNPPLKRRPGVRCSGLGQSSGQAGRLSLPHALEEWEENEEQHEHAGERDDADALIRRPAVRTKFVGNRIRAQSKSRVFEEIHAPRRHRVNHTGQLLACGAANRLDLGGDFPRASRSKWHDSTCRDGISIARVQSSCALEIVTQPLVSTESTSGATRGASGYCIRR
jgi:hypothetical protein